MKTRTIATLLLFCAFPIYLFAQEYYVVLETREIKLYLGYVNQVRVEILDKNLTQEYAFHATASGADLDYDKEGRMSILPNQKSGVVNVYGEKDGIFYEVGQLKFTAITPSTTDEAFISTMGITEADPKTKLPQVIKFEVKGKKTVKANDIALSGFSIVEIKPGINNIWVTVIEKRDSGNRLLTKENVTIESPDAAIIKLSNRNFTITPNTGKRECKLIYFLGDKKIYEKSVIVSNSQ